MSTVPIYGEQLIKPIQYAEEPGYGSFPTNPAMNWIGYSANFVPYLTTNPYVSGQPGNEDLQLLYPRGNLVRFTVEYRPQDSTFLKYAINSQGGGSGTIDKSLSLLFSAPLGGSGSAETYYQILGCRPDSLNLYARMGPGQGVRASVLLHGQTILTPTTTNPIGSGSFATDPQTLPFILEFDHIQIAGTTYDVDAVDLFISRNLKPLWPPGSNLLQDLRPQSRIIRGRLSILWENTTPQVDLQSNTGVTITWQLRAGISTVTMNGCKLQILDSLRLRPGLLKEIYQFTAQNATVT